MHVWRAKTMVFLGTEQNRRQPKIIIFDGGRKLMHENHWLNSIDTDFMPRISNYIFVWIFGSLLFYVSENGQFDLVQGFIDYHNFDMVFIDCSWSK